MTRNSIASVTLKLLDYCRANNWAGYDPYDALNSERLDQFPCLNARIPRLLLTQTLKRCPFNLRPLLRVRKTQNPKALALFASALLKLRELNLIPDETLLQGLLAQISALRSSDRVYWSWGYSFPWQTRTILVPRGAPNLVCTTFVANTLLDVFEKLGNTSHLEMAVSAGKYLLKKLYYTEGDKIASFSYPLPRLKAKVHNANFLAAALLSRLYYHTGDEKLLGPTLRVARYSAGQQRGDGSWSYGEGRKQNWVDNFHSGYNLGALRVIGQNLSSDEFEPCVQRGFEYYRKHFFREDGSVRYFHDRSYPIDTHCVAQSLLTLLEFKDLHPTNSHLIGLVYAWVMSHLWDKRGFFYYRVHRIGTSHIPYMRWSQAWMLLALTALLEGIDGMSSLAEGRAARQLSRVGG